MPEQAYHSEIDQQEACYQPEWTNSKRSKPVDHIKPVVAKVAYHNQDSDRKDRCRRNINRIKVDQRFQTKESSQGERRRRSEPVAENRMNHSTGLAVRILPVRDSILANNSSYIHISII